MSNHTTGLYRYKGTSDVTEIFYFDGYRWYFVNKGYAPLDFMPQRGKAVLVKMEETGR